MQNDDEPRLQRLNGCDCTNALNIDPARISITMEVSKGTRVTLNRVPCGLCAHCDAPFFHPDVADAVDSIRGLFRAKGLGHIERSYKDMVRRYWVH